MVGIMAPVQKARHALTDRADNPDVVQWPALRHLYCILRRAQHLLVIDPYLGAVTSEPVSAGRQRQLKPAVIACRGRKLLARRIAGDDGPGQWQRRWWSRQGCRAADSHEHASHRLAVWGLAAAASHDQYAGHHASGNAASPLHVSLDARPPSLVSCHMGTGVKLACLLPSAAHSLSEVRYRLADVSNDTVARNGFNDNSRQPASHRAARHRCPERRRGRELRARRG